MESLGYITSNIISGSNGLLLALQSGKLIYMRGSNEQNEGHAFVIDGCHYMTVHYYEAMQNEDGLWQIINDAGTKHFDYNHVNWGWNGDGNGYYLASVFDARNPYTLDGHSPSGSEDLNYSYNNKYFTVFH